MPRKRTSKLGTVTIKRGPRKGQRVLAYVYPSGKWSEVRRGRGSTVERRKAARKAGLKDRFGRTAEDRSKERAAQRKKRGDARAAKGKTRSGRSRTAKRGDKIATAAMRGRSKRRGRRKGR